MQSRVLAATIAALLVAGCAKRAEDISASYVSPIAYQSWTCPQLAEESARISMRASELAGIQDKKATGDAVKMGVGIVVFWPALLFIKGNSNTSSELARIKGEAEAVQQASIRQNCGIQFQQADAPSKTRAQ